MAQALEIRPAAFLSVDLAYRHPKPRTPDSQPRDLDAKPRTPVPEPPTLDLKLGSPDPGTPNPRTLVRSNHEFPEF